MLPIYMNIFLFILVVMMSVILDLQVNKKNKQIAKLELKVLDLQKELERNPTYPPTDKEIIFNAEGGYTIIEKDQK